MSLLALSSGCERATAPTTLVYADRPVNVPQYAMGWKAVSVGGAHTCGIRIDGKLACWGQNSSGQLGVGMARGKCGARLLECEGSPRLVASPERFISVSAGQRHTCAIATSGSLFCFGENFQFQTGVQGGVFVTTPQSILPEFQFLEVAAGATHTCAVRSNGIVYCWGEGQLGALGRGDSLSSVLPMPIASDERFTRVGSGRLRSCAIATDGTPWCWGSEWEGNDASFDYFHTRLFPHAINGVPPMKDISVASSSICAVSIAGNPYCWESNSFAQLGLGTLVGSETPALVATQDGFANVSAGIIQTCGTTTAGKAKCWGNNTFGQLGVPRPGDHCGPGFLECSRVPIAVFGDLSFTGVVTGFGNHTCGISTLTAILCWGLGSDGQLGDGFTRDRQSLPVGVLAPAP